MKFGRTSEERAARRAEKARCGKFVLVPRQLDSGRWAWFERVPYRDELRCYVNGAWYHRTYFDVPKGDA